MVGIAPGQAKISVKNLIATYTSYAGDQVLAVDDVSFAIADKPGIGEVVVLLGPSGSGKSTILKCVAGLLPPTSGSIEVCGQFVRGTSADRGMVFQSYTSFDWRTVRSNVEYGLEIAGVGKADRRERAEAALKKVGLIEYADRYPKQLSGGQKQRVAIARTIVNNPKVLLMDEPFGALDPQTRWGMQSLIIDLAVALDNTTVLVTHDVTEAVYVADMIYILSPRPAKILHAVAVPHFDRHDPALRQSADFREVESQVLDYLRGAGNVRVS